MFPDKIHTPTMEGILQMISDLSQISEEKYSVCMEKQHLNTLENQVN